jgi:hypothetical protein
VLGRSVTGRSVGCRHLRALGLLPPWLRRGLEAGLIAALVAILTLVGSTSGASGGRISLPEGPAGSLLLAPAVLALGVITVGYPVAYAATRPHAILGTLAAFLVGADLAAVVLSTIVVMSGLGREMTLGVLAGVLALGPALVGLGAGQLLTPLGFGRRSGAVSTAAAAAFALLVLALASRLG